MTHVSDKNALLSYGWPGTYFLGEEEKAAVIEVIDARSPNRFFGPAILGFSSRLESRFAERLAKPHALAVNSCTAALTIAMEALDIGPGDEVMIPALMWVSCIGAVVRAGAIPRIVEVDDSFTIDPADMERKCGPNTRAVLAVHMSGAPCNMDAVMTIATEHNLLVIEDIAQANGGSFGGAPLGSFGDAAVLSFQVNKNMTAGEGGLVAFRNEEHFQRAVGLHDVGYRHNDRGFSDVASEPAPGWGHGGHMNEISAAVLVEQEKKLDAIVDGMRRANRRIRQGLSRVRGATVRRLNDADGDTGPFLMVTWPTPEACRRIVLESRLRGVDAGPLSAGNMVLADFGLHLYSGNRSLVEKTPVNKAGHPWSLPENQFAAGYDYGYGTLPKSDDLFARTQMLAIAPVLTVAQCDGIVDLLAEVSGS